MSSKQDWTCPMCSKHNFASRQSCFNRACSYAKPMCARTQRAGDWICAHCGDMQFSTRTECRKCHTPKGSSPPPKEAAAESKHAPFAMKPGDWVCVNCADVQFASRNKCRTCSETKPATNEDPDESICAICFERVRNAAFVHGTTAHTICCLECAGVWHAMGKLCPMCNQKIDLVVENFT